MVPLPAEKTLRILLVFIAAMAGLIFPSGARAADAAHPTVVELFQSQGCSSCPPANANLNALAGRADILALSFGVTYWDQLGWKDTFATPQFTARQWEYARGLKHDEVWTPQVVINGRRDIVGTRRDALATAIAQADRGNTGPTINVNDVNVEVNGSITQPVDVWLVRYDPRSVEVAISRGENDGKTLPHRNIVRQLIKLGQWHGGKARFALPAATIKGLSTAAFIQAGSGGEIVAAVRG